MSRAVGSYVSSAESWTSWTLRPRRWCSLPWNLRRCWPGVVRSSAWHKGGSGVELHRPGCDRCWPCCISSSACLEDRVSGVLRARRACGVCFWRWRRRQGRAGYVWTVYEMACFLFHVQGTSSCDHAATSSAVLHRISYDVVVVPQLSSSTVWTVYEMAWFLCFPLL